MVPLGLVRDLPGKHRLARKYCTTHLTALLPSIPSSHFNSGSSPIMATTISFWSLLITQYAKYEAAKMCGGTRARAPHGSALRGHVLRDALRGLRGAYPEPKFVRPEGMPRAASGSRSSRTCRPARTTATRWC